MTTEKYQNWNLIDSHPREFHFWELNMKSNRLIILFKKFTSEEILKVEFSGILTFKYTIEGGRLKTVYEQEVVGVFLTSTNSDYFNWFKDENGGTFDDWSLKHIAINSSDCIIDIITNETPSIEWIK